MLLRRELLGIFCHVWKFIKETYRRRMPMRQSVRRELRHARALLPLAVANGRQRWSTEVWSFDASKTGFGVVQRELPVEEVRKIGSVCERARFSGPLVSGGVGAREAALQEDNWHMSDASALLLGRVAKFPEVPNEVLQASWATHASRRWRKGDSIHVLEGLALMWTLRHVSRVDRL